jgi:hypothetical protein
MPTTTVTVAIGHRAHPITLTPVNPSGWDLTCVECGAAMRTSGNPRTEAIRAAKTELHARALTAWLKAHPHERVPFGTHLALDGIGAL